MNDYLQVGVITSTHGIKGEVKVFPTTDDPQRFLDLKNVWLDTGSGMRQLTVSQVKFFKQFVILKFAEFGDINEIEPYRKRGLYVDREHAVPLEEDEYFIADLIGMKVESDQGEALGELVDVIETGANDVYVVKTKEGKEILIPAIRQCILSVEIEERTMRVHLLKGLVD
mgnify:CR=1 FL=1